MFSSTCFFIVQTSWRRPSVPVRSPSPDSRSQRDPPRDPRGPRTGWATPWSDRCPGATVSKWARKNQCKKIISWFLRLKRCWNTVFQIVLQGWFVEQYTKHEQNDITIIYFIENDQQLSKKKCKPLWEEEKLLPWDHLLWHWRCASLPFGRASMQGLCAQWCGPSGNESATIST